VEVRLYEFGARTRNRTKDTGIFNPFKKDQMLYQH
jgi:hypothetical protein